jgi:hypothetical protein
MPTRGARLRYEPETVLFRAAVYRCGSGAATISQMEPRRWTHAAESAGRFESGHDRRREPPYPAPLDRNECDERRGLFLAGALLAVLAWVGLGTAPRSAALIVAVFAAAFMAAALAGSLRRRRTPRMGRASSAARRRDDDG